MKQVETRNLENLCNLKKRIISINIFSPKILLTSFSRSFLTQIGGRSQITLCIFHCFLTTHPPYWHNVVCERPLIQNHSLRMDDSFSKAVEESIHFKDKDPSLGRLPRDLVMLERKGRELIGTQITGLPILQPLPQ